MMRILHWIQRGLTSPFSLADLTYRWDFYNSDSNDEPNFNEPFKEFIDDGNGNDTGTGTSFKEIRDPSHNFTIDDGTRAFFYAVLKTTSPAGCVSDSTLAPYAEPKLLVQINPSMGVVLG